MTGDPRLDPESRQGRDGPPNRRRTTGPVPRFGHGSRVPGWDEAVDLTKDPATIPDPATTPVPPRLRERIAQAMAKYPDRRSAAIPALHAAQEEHGWCSPEAIAQVSAVMQLTPAYLTSVATFYDMFKTLPMGRHDVYVCTNISCSLRGADEFFEAMREAAEDDRDINVRSFECLGACDIAPMASVDGEYVGPLELDDAARIVEDLRAGRAVLDHKQLRYRRCADPDVAEEAGEFSPPDPGQTEMADTAGLGPEGENLDRPGGSAAIEVRAEQAEEADESGDSGDGQ
ncbi:MAG: NAD(P)H-dependent oxidoreductase subunit E [Solirubrobacterales bacterium]|nr:NAD(P)H-dependent oxidoreductase subunit E [Solirubrobacterales bacterium]MBV9944278.1 NAD(P)H-dependent oxidoreductase subunit E [Solirubrobacterales bacterium]